VNDCEDSWAEELAAASGHIISDHPLHITSLFHVDDLEQNAGVVRECRDRDSLCDPDEVTNGDLDERRHEGDRSVL
jgi:hypothetical protein